MPALLLALGLLAAADPPAPEAKPPPRHRIAVLDLEAAGAAPELAKGASLLLPTEVRSRAKDAQVIGSAEISTLLGLEKQKALLGCHDEACMVEIAGALGAEEIVAGRLAKIGKTFVLELRRMDARKAQVTASATRTVTGEEDAILDALRSAVAELWGEKAEARPRPPAPQPPSIDAKPPPPAMTPPPPETQGATRLTAANCLTGSGALLLVAGGAGIGYSVYVHNQWELQQPGGSNAAQPTVTRAEAERIDWLYPTSWALTATGAVSLGLGIWRNLATPGPAVALAPVPGGGVIAVGGAF